ncbi:hypothetical protein SODALDRAFT_333336 [Sodiomyces alkalinus F11]|uniref:Uncharacterized protein n=1 Tax=Sodiomyces alkalinus (strain CBS 110278 / VKM F-3762 / F11) TaxID=1314773 RepID=A0A3N2PW30_SODAK|nr:hypothetical protein SODALDRAFT_333336 [Sodiomyces alkalinus F11]ROT38713.1 hypothetical protein SODALDRAFT_333336 [Sodiomyces alkalinus F11]
MEYRGLKIHHDRRPPGRSSHRIMVSQSALDQSRRQRERRRNHSPKRLGQTGHSIYDHDMRAATAFGTETKKGKLDKLLSLFKTAHHNPSSSPEHLVSHPHFTRVDGRNGIESGPQTRPSTSTFSSAQHPAQPKVGTQLDRSKLGRLNEALRSNPALVEPRSTRSHEKSRQGRTAPSSSSSSSSSQKPVFRLEVTPPSESRADPETSRDVQKKRTRQSHSARDDSQLKPPRNNVLPGNWHRTLYHHERVNDEFRRENRRLERERDELIRERQRLKKEKEELAAEKEEMRHRFNCSWRSFQSLLDELGELETQLSGSHRAQDESASPSERLRKMVAMVEASHTRQLQSMWRDHEQTVAELVRELERANRALRCVVASRHAVGNSPGDREYERRISMRYPVRR